MVELETERKPIGLLLQEVGVVSEADVAFALQLQDEVKRKRIGELLVDAGSVNESDVCRALARQLNLNFLNLGRMKIPTDAYDGFSELFARKHLCMPFRRLESHIEVAMCDPLDLLAIEDLEKSTGCNVHIALATRNDIIRAINKYYVPLRLRNGAAATKAPLFTSPTQRGIFDDHDLPSRMYAVVSNKGGVGKTHFALNLACSLARRERNVLLIDADLSNADVVNKAGIYRRYTLVDFMQNERSLEEIMVKTRFGFHFIGGTSGDFALANLNHTQRIRFIKNFQRISELFDVVLFDLGAGVHSSVIDFALAADEMLVVTTPRNLGAACGCIRAAYQRFAELETKLGERISGYKMKRILRPKVILNQVMRRGDGRQHFRELLEQVNSFEHSRGDEFGLVVNLWGEIPYDSKLYLLAEHKHTPIVELAESHRVSESIRDVMSRVLQLDKLEQRRTKTTNRFRRFAEIFMHRH